MNSISSIEGQQFRILWKERIYNSFLTIHKKFQIIENILSYSLKTFEIYLAYIKYAKYPKNTLIGISVEYYNENLENYNTLVTKTNGS